MRLTGHPLIGTLRDCLRNGHHVALGIFRFLIPIVIIVKILEVSGVIQWIAMPVRPFMDILGLPAEFGLAWVTGMLTSIFSGLVVLVSLLPGLPEVSVAQMTVFGLLALIAHSLVLEVRIAGHCGASMPFQLILRLASAFLAAFLLHLILDGFGLLQGKAQIFLAAEPTANIAEWGGQQLFNLVQMYVIICLVMILQKALDAFRISEYVGRLLGPLLRILGISGQAVSIVIIGFTMGILYGSGSLISRAQENQLSGRDIFCSISLLGLSHSLIEDTLLLTLVGASLWGLLAYRILFTLFIGALLNAAWPVLERFAVKTSQEIHRRKHDEENCLD